MTIINVEKVLCIIPARMGSTRVKWKNLREIEPGLSLVGQAMEVAQGFPTCISTDQPDLFNVSSDILMIERPPEISDSVSNVSHAISHALKQCEIILDRKFEFVVTLMPAIAGRSKEILKDMLEHFSSHPHLRSMLSVATTHPWIWKVSQSGDSIQNSWHPNPAQNSQALPYYYTEHASIIINKRDVVIDNQKLSAPLMLYQLPAWCACLDIDTEVDIQHASLIYPAAKCTLTDWKGAVHIVQKIQTIRPD